MKTSSFLIGRVRMDVDKNVMKSLIKHAFVYCLNEFILMEFIFNVLELLIKWY